MSVKYIFLHAAFNSSGYPQGPGLSCSVLRLVPQLFSSEWKHWGSPGYDYPSSLTELLYYLIMLLYTQKPMEVQRLFSLLNQSSEVLLEFNLPL